MLPENTSQKNKLKTLNNLQLQTEDFSKWLKTKVTSHTLEAANVFLLQFSSPNTRRSYQNDLKEFFLFLQETFTTIPEDVNEITFDHLILWKKSLEDKCTLKQSSISRKLKCLSSFFQFCESRKLITSNPTELLQRPRAKISEPTPAFTRDETKNLLMYLDMEVKKVQGQSLKNYHSALLKKTVIEILFTTGMRVNELCELRLGDVTLHKDNIATLNLTTKGSRDFFVTLPEDVSSQLLLYIRECRKDSQNHEYIFSRAQKTKKETKLSQAAIYSMLRKTAAAIGITKKVGPHSCRATLATELHRDGIPLKNIQKQLNHKSITTTSLYVKRSNEISEAAALKINILKNNDE